MGIFGLCIILFCLIWTSGLSILKAESKKMVDLKLKNQTADAQLDNLESSKKEISKYSYFKNIAQTVIPNDKDQAEAVLEIFQLANQSGISIQSVTFPSSTLGSRTSATGASASATISQAKPVKEISGLYSVELNIQPETSGQVAQDKVVTYAKMLDFLHRIENNRRTAQITQVNIQPNEDNTQINFSLTVNIFIKP